MVDKIKTSLYSRKDLFISKRKKRPPASKHAVGRRKERTYGEPKKGAAADIPESNQGRHHKRAKSAISTGKMEQNPNRHQKRSPRADRKRQPSGARERRHGKTKTIQRIEKKYNAMLF